MAATGCFWGLVRGIFPFAGAPAHGKIRFWCFSGLGAHDCSVVQSGNLRTGQKLVVLFRIPSPVPRPQAFSNSPGAGLSPVSQSGSKSPGASPGAGPSPVPHPKACSAPRPVPHPLVCTKSPGAGLSPIPKSSDIQVNHPRQQFDATGTRLNIAMDNRQVPISQAIGIFPLPLLRLRFLYLRHHGR